MEIAELEKRYEATSASTQARWQACEGPGALRPPYYSAHRLALATGFQPEMSPSIGILFDELRAITGDDPLVDLQPQPGFHFTFVPLTLPLYEERAPLPAKTQQLMEAWSPFAGQRIRIRALRLVALPGQLLLAGIPDAPAPELRKTFCNAILHTQWEEELRLRHAQTPLPAPFWHTTLLRYQAEYLPEYLREFFRTRQMQRYGEVSGELQLRLINYNWTTCSPVIPSMIAR